MFSTEKTRLVSVVVFVQHACGARVRTVRVRIRDLATWPHNGNPTQQTRGVVRAVSALRNNLTCTTTLRPVALRADCLRDSRVGSIA